MKRDKQLLSLTGQLKKLKYFISTASLTEEKRAIYLSRLNRILQDIAN